MSKKRTGNPPIQPVESRIISSSFSSVDWVVLGAIIVASLIIWLPTKNLPYHWDSAGFVINAARELIAVNFSPLVVPFSDFAHPPLFIALLALLWKVFSESLVTSHLLMLPFLPMLLFGTYCIGKKVFSIETGIISAAAVAAIPVVVAEYGIVYIDLPMAAVTTLALAAWFHKKFHLSAFLFSAAVLIKLPAVVVPLTLLAYTFLFSKKNWRRELIPLGVPVLVLIAWLGYHQVATGWLLTVPGRQTNTPTGFIELIKSFNHVFSYLLIKQYRFLLILVAFGSLSTAYLTSKLDTNWKKILPLVFIPLSGIGFFTLVGEFMPRYGLFLLPPVVVVAFGLLTTFVRWQWLRLIVSIGVAGLFMTLWHPVIAPTIKYEFMPSADNSYRDIIEIGRDAAHFVSVYYPESVVYGGFPEVYQLTQPFQGYIDEKVDFQLCNTFILTPEKEQLIYIHPYSPSQMTCRMLLDHVRVNPLKRFESNGKWLEVYLVDATASAQLQLNRQQLQQIDQ